MGRKVLFLPVHRVLSREVSCQYNVAKSIHPDLDSIAFVLLGGDRSLPEAASVKDTNEKPTVSDPHCEESTSGTWRLASQADSCMPTTTFQGRDDAPLDLAEERSQAVYQTMERYLRERPLSYLPLTCTRTCLQYLAVTYC